jgi:KUP system potassium uptake protein
MIIIDRKNVNINQVPEFDRVILRLKTMIKRITVTPKKWFGLQLFDVDTEILPLLLKSLKDCRLMKVAHEITILENATKEIDDGYHTV